ncbi:MAG: GTP cyclohydrolase I FolE [Planctomycetes bacterium]|nr:GTP cyclohydrolase I FolE [Planctomycetota bacterium]
MATNQKKQVNFERIEKAVLEILEAVGEDPRREGLCGTPRRVARMYAELLAGMRHDPAEHLKSIFHEKYDEIVLLRDIPFYSICEHHLMPFIGKAHVAYLMYAELLAGMRHDPVEHLKSIFHEKYDEIVLLRDIPFYSICEHHLMPFIGKAHVAYLPAGQVLGVSKLARVVDSFARRLQLQERLTEQIADFLMKNLKPQGVTVVLEASHSCMTIRGIQKPGAVMVTSALRGIFKSDPRSRSEVMALLHKSEK